jgi:hypothetical protein
MEPVNSQASQNWTAETANEALSRIKPYDKGQIVGTMLSIIGGIVAGISFVAGSPTIAFTAVVITGLSVAYVIYCKSKISSITQELQDRGLTRELQSKLALSVFEKALNETGKWTIESNQSFTSKIDNIFEGIASFHWLSKRKGIIETFHDISAKKEWERINLWVVEKAMNGATKFSLLSLAVNNNVVLFFSSLQKTANFVEGQKKEFIRLKARESALISAQFVKNCLESTSEGDLDIVAINRQLKALAPIVYKDLDSIDTDVTIFPIVQIRKNEEDAKVVVELTANPLSDGAEGNVGDLIEIFGSLNITIEIINDGWLAATGATFDSLISNWNNYIQQYTQSMKYPAIIDRTSEGLQRL